MAVCPRGCHSSPRGLGYSLGGIGRLLCGSEWASDTTRLTEAKDEPMGVQDGHLFIYEWAPQHAHSLPPGFMTIIKDACSRSSSGD